MKKKLYLSGPITGTDGYMEKFAGAEERMAEKGYEVINPAKICSFLPEDTGYEQYMDLAFCLLGMADVIYMLPGWQKSIGANREYGYALGAGMEIVMEGGVFPKERRSQGETECSSEDCAYYQFGQCRLPSVKGRMPDITESDGCVDFICTPASEYKIFMLD